MSDYSVARREEMPDFMERYPGFGEMRGYTDGADCEQVAFSWRLMPAGTGGRGSYGHRHRTQEEVFEAGPKSAVRIAPHALRSLHNDGPGEAEILLFSVKRAEDGDDEVEQVEGFWPDEK